MRRGQSLCPFLPTLSVRSGNQRVRPLSPPPAGYVPHRPLRATQMKFNPKHFLAAALACVFSTMAVAQAPTPLPMYADLTPSRPV